MTNPQIVDISKWQGVVPVATFKAWKDAGVERVVVKAGGADDGIYADSAHPQNVANARVVGLGIDHYFFNGPGTASALAQAVVRYSAPAPGDRLWLDVEGNRWSAALTLDVAQTVKQLSGLTAGVYMSASITAADNWAPLVEFGSALWVASYGANTGNAGAAPSIKYWPAWTYWQYTSVGHLPGFNGNLDLDAANGAVASATTSKEPEMAQADINNAKAALVLAEDMATGGVKIAKWKVIINEVYENRLGPNRAADPTGMATALGIMALYQDAGAHVDAWVMSSVEYKNKIKK